MKELLDKITKFVESKFEEAWDKMGNTGEDGYWDNATRDELFWFGYFRALEDLKDILDDK